MGWTAPRTWTVGEMTSKVILDAHVRDNLRYLKGLDGVITLSSGLIIPDGAGSYLQLPSLTTTQRDALTPAAGMVIYNSTLTVFQRYEAAAWVSYTDLAKMTIASIAQGDIFYRGASVVERLAAGTSGNYLKTQGAGANPVWAVPTITDYVQLDNSQVTSPNGTWVDWDLSADIPAGAKAVVVIFHVGTSTVAGARKNGTTHFSLPIVAGYYLSTFVVPLDSGRIIEIYANVNNGAFEAMGYFS